MAQLVEPRGDLPVGAGLEQLPQEPNGHVRRYSLGRRGSETELARLGVRTILQKPFTLEELKKALAMAFVDPPKSR